MKETAQIQAMVQNLVDAGCDTELIGQFMNLLETEQKTASLALLAKHRKSLLDRCHAEEKRIYCLDYLIYKINKGEVFLSKS